MPPKGKAPAAGAERGRGVAAGAILAVTAWVLLAHLGLAGKLGVWGGVLPSLGVGALLGLLGAARLLWLANFLAVAMLTATVATPDVARQFTRRFVRDDSVPKDGVQAVVVLSAMLTADGQLDGVGADRLLTGPGLAKRLGTPILVTTRFRLPEDPAITTEADQGRLIALAGLGARWIVTREVFDTRDEAQATAALAAREGFTRVAVVTSPMHTRRACALFEREKLSVTCVAATSRDAAFRSLKSPADRVRAVRLGMYETIAWAYYRLRGWL